MTAWGFPAFTEMSRIRLLERIFRFLLAIVLAGVLLEPISSSATPGNSSSSDVPTCDKAGTSPGELRAQLDLTLSSDSDSVSFKCSSAQEATREPSNGNVYTDESCSQDHPLATVYTNAKLSESIDADKIKYTLTIPKGSRTTEKVLCYKCTLPSTDPEGKSIATQTEGKVCKVKITVDAVEPIKPEPESSDEQSTGVIECTGADTTKEASVSAESPLSFKCGAGMSLHPTNLTDVFDDQDGKCAAEVALQTLVDATLTKTDAEATHNEQPVYRLVVKTAPPEDTALCYKCVTTSSNLETKTNSGEESAAKECLLKISVKGSPSSAFSPTWGSPQGALVFFVAAQMMLSMS
ncbi:SRS domain-containing protein [Neospora caninum Liverpool]|uniref:SRS domain-containing protein n=1 Tax=Neospora caninum (strain Liverpool) TaxID=572307 RepID=F0VL91_NEOCL|nr:SRS domain-containing protein [Neospora caninum Liverpool]CBZ54843.1 SRS domain-containing protein [Neospora caninum Liverpool]CEL69562.1 TPA: SRS domain-containing protein [Neospora caninum Liverpool]|eukprot:XP_003884871.1 SRS domain-containing protein [Neospora caninum Liverpool]